MARSTTKAKAKAATTACTGFVGFRPAAFAFFRGLRDNNDPDWFKPRKAVYETEVLAPLPCFDRGGDGGARRGRHPAGRRPRARHLPHLPRCALFARQAALQDACRGGADPLRRKTRSRASLPAPRTERVDGGGRVLASRAAAVDAAAAGDRRAIPIAFSRLPRGWLLPVTRSPPMRL